MNEINLLIATPAYGGQVQTDYLHSMVALIRGAMKAGIGAEIITIGNESLITRARNTLISYFYQHREFSHIIFVDADIRLDNQIVPNLLKRRVDVIGCPVPLKGVDDNGVPLVNVGRVYSLDDTGLAVVECVGTAVFMLSRKASDSLVNISDKYQKSQDYSRGDKAPITNYDVFSVGVVDQVYLSEDFYVCQKLRQLGFKIHVDTTALIRHSGMHGFSLTKDQMMETMKCRLLSST